MTSPKSRNERIRRRLRSSKKLPGIKNNKIVIKKHADTDPECKNSYSRNKLKEDFIKFYKTGSAKNIIDLKNFKNLIENLISISVENAGQLKLPYDLSRINELSKIIKEQEEKEEPETRTYEITGKSDLLDKLELFFKIIANLGHIGSSRNVVVDFDGDGRALFKFKDLDGNDIVFSDDDIPEDFKKSIESGSDIRIVIE